MVKQPYIMPLKGGGGGDDSGAVVHVGNTLDWVDDHAMTNTTLTPGAKVNDIYVVASTYTASGHQFVQGEAFLLIAGAGGNDFGALALITEAEALKGYSEETWTFTLSDNTTVTKTVLVKAVS